MSALGARFGRPASFFFFRGRRQIARGATIMRADGRAGDARGQLWGFEKIE
jgi:hypothetical protein